MVKELGKIAPQPREKGRPPARAGRSEEARATVYQKHRALRSREATYRA